MVLWFQASSRSPPSSSSSFTTTFVKRAFFPLDSSTHYWGPKENTTKKQTYATSQEMIDDLKGWMVRYDFYRPHRQLGRKTPYEAVCDWHKKEPDRFLKEPSSLLTYRTDRSQPPET